MVNQWKSRSKDILYYNILWNIVQCWYYMLGKRFGLEYNNKLMKYCVYIIYTIAISDSTYIMKIIKRLQ